MVSVNYLSTKKYRPAPIYLPITKLHLFCSVCTTGSDCCAECRSGAYHCPHHPPPLVSYTHSVDQSVTLHTYSDHAGGNEKLVSMVSNLTVCGNDDRIGALNKRVKHKDQFKVLNPPSHISHAHMHTHTHAHTHTPHTHTHTHTMGCR